MKFYVNLKHLNVAPLTHTKYVHDKHGLFKTGKKQLLFYITFVSKVYEHTILLKKQCIKIVKLFRY